MDLGEGIQAEEEADARKRKRSELVNFGDDVGTVDVEISKVAKYEEGEVPKTIKTGEESEKIEKSSSVASVKATVEMDIFDEGDEADYEHSTDKATRLSYLTATGAKIKKSSKEASTFQDLTARHRSAESIPKDYLAPSRTSTQKSPSKPRNKLEQQEFVKDSVQNRIARESVLPVSSKVHSKGLDFNSFFQSVQDRQSRIKLATAEQVNLDGLMAQQTGEEFDAPEEMDLSLEEEDDISIEIDEEDNEKVAVSSNSNHKSTNSTDMPPPTAIPNYKSNIKSRQVVVEDDVDSTEIKAIESLSAPPVPPKEPTTALLLKLEDFYLEEDDEPVDLTIMAAIKPPTTSSTSKSISEPASQTTDSQTSVTDSSSKIELTPSLQLDTQPTVTAGDVKLKKPESAAKPPSLISSWLSGKTSTAKPTTSSMKEKAKEKPKKDEPLILEFFDENANTGERELANKKRLSRPKQLFDDEAEQGFGSDASQGEGEEAQSTSSDEKKDGGASQDEYEDEVGEVKDDVFETDDRMVIRSVMMAQERAREEEEARFIEAQALRLDRRRSRFDKALQDEANMLLEDRRMEERMAARREKRRNLTANLSHENEDQDDAKSESDTQILTSGNGEREWFLDDDEDDENGDETGEKQKLLREKEAKRVEALAARNERLRLSSSSQYLWQDEGSQSILQLIEKVNTQHSQLSGSSGVINDFTTIEEASQEAFSLVGLFERPSTFSATSVEHLNKLKSTFKGSSTQLVSSALLFQRSHDSSSQDGLNFSSSSMPIPSSSSNDLKSPTLTSSSSSNIRKPTTAPNYKSTIAARSSSSSTKASATPSLSRSKSNGAAAPQKKQ